MRAVAQGGTGRTRRAVYRVQNQGPSTATRAMTSSRPSSIPAINTVVPVEPPGTATAPTSVAMPGPVLVSAATAPKMASSAVTPVTERSAANPEQSRD